MLGLYIGLRGWIRRAEEGRTVPRLILSYLRQHLNLTLTVSAPRISCFGHQPKKANIYQFLSVYFFLILSYLRQHLNLMKEVLLHFLGANYQVGTGSPEYEKKIWWWQTAMSFLPPRKQSPAARKGRQGSQWYRTLFAPPSHHRRKTVVRKDDYLPSSNVPLSDNPHSKNVQFKETYQCSMASRRSLNILDFWGIFLHNPCLLESDYLYIYLEIPPTIGAIRRVNQSTCSPEEDSKESSEDKEFLLTFVWYERKRCAKLEIDSLYICEKKPRNIGAITKV